MWRLPLNSTTNPHGLSNATSFAITVQHCIDIINLDEISEDFRVRVLKEGILFYAENSLAARVSALDRVFASGIKDDLDVAGMIKYFEF